MEKIIGINTRTNESIEELVSRINYLSRCNIHSIRCNLKNLHMEDINRVDKILEAMLLSKKVFKVYIDVPFPYKKVRLNSILDKEIKKDDIITVYKDKLINQHELPYLDGTFSYNLNQELYYGDGEGVLRVVDFCNSYVKFQALNDFKLFGSKSISTQEVIRTELENYKIEFLKRITLDFNNVNLMLSFCDNKNSINDFKKQLNNRNINIYPKIESTEGINNLKEIILNSNGVIIARGDLAMFTNLSSFYDNCKYIASVVKENNGKVIVATDILNSLIYQNFPTRSDIIDYNLLKVFGVDGIMLKSSFSYLRRVEELNKFLYKFQ